MLDLVPAEQWRLAVHLVLEGANIVAQDVVIAFILYEVADCNFFFRCYFNNYIIIEIQERKNVSVALSLAGGG